MKVPKKVALLLTMTLVGGAIIANTSYADSKVENLTGDGRWETAIKISQNGWKTSDEVIIVNESSIVDALCATPFAKAKNAPILLTQKKKLDERTKLELMRLGAKKVYIVGGEGVLDKELESNLKRLGIKDVERISGSDRYQTSLKLAAAFAAGSPVVLKPSEETPFAAVIVAEIFDKVDVPKGVFNLVNGDGAGDGNPLSEHPKVRMMSFTGSGPTGSKIMEKAAKDFKKVSLELGGKSPYIVLDDVDIKEAAKATTGKVVNNTGQVCTAGTRVLVPNKIKDAFLAELKEQFSQVRVGNPREDGTQVGPIISKKQFDQVQNYINKGIEEGAELFYGGPGKPEGLEKGYFARPTIFINVDNQMTIAQEEIFGPVMSVITYNDLDEAIQIANDTKYGLAGYVIGKDKETLHKVARSIEAGTVEINEAGRKPDLPFGGYKQSGLGREWGDYGIEEFLEVKSIAGYFK